MPSVLSGRVDPNLEVSLGVLPMQLLKTCLQSLIPVVVFQDCDWLGGWLAIGSEKGHPMTIACGINSDANAVERRGRGHGNLLEQNGQQICGDVRQA